MARHPDPIPPTPLIPLYLYLGYPLARPSHLYDYLLAEQGIIKRLETRFVSADTLLAPLSETLIGLHLARYPFQPVQLKVPRIPGRLLRDVLQAARQNLNLEIMFHFRCDPTTRRWTVTCPAQDQSRVRVGYRDPNQADIVLELHSHHVMPAFFSPTDDSDEQGSRFYAVIGHLDRAQPQLMLRLGIYGHWLRNIPALTLFDDPGPFVDTYDEAAPLPEAVENDGWSFTNLFRRSSI